MQPMNPDQIDYTMSMVERRVFRRVEFREAVEIQGRDMGLGQGGLAADLSEGGLRVNLFEFVPLDAELAVYIRISPEQIVEQTGRVVWVKKMPFADRYQLGLEFVAGNTPLESREAIHRFVGAQ